MSSKSFPDSLPIGSSLLWYEILQVLGKGGFGITYLAKDTNLDQLVAIKEYLPAGFAARQDNKDILPNSPSDSKTFEWGLDRFIKEAQLLARFKHPNIVRVMSFFRDRNTAYMVMDFEEGQSLEDILKNRGFLPETELLRILEPLLSGIETLHKSDFIHRDIKPANILIRKNGKPVILDFGSARQSLPGRDQMTSLLSLGYSPYEQYDSSGVRQGPWSDIYALGAVLYRAVTGKKPVDAALRIGSRLRNEPDAMTPALDLAKGRYSSGLLKAIDKALMVLETERPQSIAAWRPMLFVVESDPEVPPRPEAAPAQSAPAQNATSSAQAVERKAKQSSWRSFIASMNKFGTELDIPDLSKKGPAVVRKPTGDTVAQPSPMAASGTPAIAEVSGAGESADAQAAQVKKQGSIWVEPVTKMEFVWIDKGRFVMGSPRGVPGRKPDEGPQREVEISGLWVAKYPVTWGKWKQVMGDPSNSVGLTQHNFPADQISWENTQRFIRTLTRLTNGANRFRLPTEAEWEFVARAGNATAFFFGDNPAQLGQYAWYVQNAAGRVHPVGMRAANPWGLYDMLGLVWEWTSDWYSDQYNATTPVRNPRGSATGEFRVCRGGSWKNPANACRCAFRLPLPEGSDQPIGFRLVCEPVEDETGEV
ncbi:MAG: SUMF1/EgtB/PvdO family nonheme iron enzyme [Magnetococcales bacterium]|nr:SUMF1/EgtB/PvdO family nonheme iron enzyme [Magnetococcales bacterium]